MFMLHKSFQQWCHFIANQMPGMDLSLDRIRKVANNMGLLPQECPVITVGGTNGKGSCVLTLEYLYHRAGYRTLSFLSPAVQSPCEQFRHQGQNITENQLIDEDLENDRIASCKLSEPGSARSSFNNSKSSAPESKVKLMLDKTRALASKASDYVSDKATKIKEGWSDFKQKSA